MAEDGVSIPIEMDDQLTPGLKEAEDAVKAFGDGAMTALGPLGLVFTALTAAVEAVSGAFTFASDKLQEWVGSAADAQDVQAKLEGQVEATGKAAGFTAEQLDIMATNIAKVTRNEDDAVKGAQSMLLKFSSIRGDVFADAIKSSANLAEVLGGGMSSAASMLGRALDDPVRGLNMLRRAGVTFTETQKESIKTMVEHGDKLGAQRMILDAVEGKVGGMAAKMAGTWNGVWENLTNRWGEFGETIGAVVLPYLEELLPVVQSVVTVIENLIPVVAEALDSFLGWGKSIVAEYVPSMEAVVTAIAVGVATVEVYVKRWDDVFDHMLLTIAHWGVELYDTLVHWLAFALPDLLKWFVDNWDKVLNDWQQYQMVVLLNVGKNFVNFMASIATLLAGGSFDFEWTALEKGFRATMAKLPDIAKRTESDLAKELRTGAEAIRDSLAEDIVVQSDDVAAKLRELMRVQLEEVEPSNFADVNMDPEAQGKKAKAEREKKAKADRDKSSGGGLEALEALHDRIAAAAGALTPGDKRIVEAIEGLQPKLDLGPGGGPMALGRDRALEDEKARAARAEALLEDQKKLLSGLNKNTAELPKLKLGFR